MSQTVNPTAASTIQEFCKSSPCALCKPGDATGTEQSNKGANEMRTIEPANDSEFRDSAATFPGTSLPFSTSNIMEGHLACSVIYKCEFATQSPPCKARQSIAQGSCHACIFSDLRLVDRLMSKPRGAGGGGRAAGGGACVG